MFSAFILNLGQVECSLPKAINIYGYVLHFRKFSYVRVFNARSDYGLTEKWKKLRLTSYRIVSRYLSH